MSRPSVDELQRLISYVVLPFYQIERATPLRFQPTRQENDAEHSWSIALVACALAPQIDKTLDVGKIAQFATVHDLAEIHAGDTSNFASEEAKASKDERERLALEKMRQDLAAFPWICQTIEAYEHQTSAEAKFVKSVDKLITLIIDFLEEGEFYKENQITLEEWKARLQGHREKARGHDAAFVYYEQMWDLLVSHPDFFYPASANFVK